MLKKSIIYNVLAVVVMAFLCLYTYMSMQLLGFEQTTGSVVSRIQFLIVVLGVLVLFMSSNHRITSFSLMWMCWIVWLLFDFFVLGLGGRNMLNIFFVLFAPMTFFFFFKTGMSSETTENIICVGFVVLFIIAFYLNIANLSYNKVVIGEETAVSNLVFWCLCAVPFLFLFKKPWVQVLFLILSVIIVLLTGKRSATIAISLIVLAFLFGSTKEKKHGFRNMFFIIIGIIAVYFIISNYLSNTFLGLVERMENMKEDQGSDRIPLYMDVFSTMKTNSFMDWLVGRGYGSILLTRHTNAHNDALQMLFEYGIVGLVFYILMLWNSIKRTILLKKTKSPYYLGYLSSTIIFIVLGAVSNLVVFNSYFAFICAYWGFVESELVKQNQIKNVRLTFGGQGQ